MHSNFKSIETCFISEYSL